MGARGGPIDPKRLLEKLKVHGRGEVLVMDADMVCGREHLLSAVTHAARSFARGSNSCNDMAMETMLFASGERQISKAQRKMAPKENSERLALVLFDSSEEESLRLASLVRDDSVLACTPDKVIAFGITRRELDTAGEGHAADLVLERVAFVEIAKR